MVDSIAKALFEIPLLVFQCLFLLHCMAPIPQNGSTQVYNYVIRPLFLKHSAKIDAALDTAVEVAEQLAVANSNVTVISDAVRVVVCLIQHVAYPVTGGFTDTNEKTGIEAADTAVSYLWKALKSQK
ncbi:hypothetical protein X801_06064 [Opisthorchis viverrini]|uniref:Uncharacterized protein n=1 Tax=Opisthorchis viverrini TaxID=6198 RepID=A0A1S8WUH3_OPIVI|nr:hypothetical protein X801_06064 [Opisthorchis viverrini]